MKKPLILMMPGPFRLFWTTGCFYLWELHRQFRFILVVPPEYEQSESFHNLTLACNVEQVVFLPTGNIVKRHFLYRKIFSKVASQFRPDILLLNNRNYPENMYAIDSCREIKRTCDVVIFQNPKWSVDWAATRELILEYTTNRIQIRYGVSKALARALAHLGKKILNLLDNTILPFVVVGKRFLPHEDMRAIWPIKKNIDRYLVSDDISHDFTLAYNKCEIEAFHAMGFPLATHVVHPAKLATPDIFKILYGAIEPSHEILVLPTVGFRSRLVSRSENTEEMASLIASLWIESLEVLANRRKDLRLAFKLHPNAYQDPLWVSIMKKLCAAFPTMKVYPPNTPVERLIIASPFIVSDVSTTLLFAAQLGGKIVLSLDIFGYIGGDDMRHYTGVHYINNIEKLRSLLLTPLDAPEASAVTIHQFFNSLVAGRKL